MYPLINTKAKGVDVVVECSQYDQGNVKYFTVDHDISGQAARYVIDLKDGTKVADWCTIIDNHTLCFAIPINCTREAGTYDAQIIFYGKNHINDEFQKWKASVLAGKERVLVVPGINDSTSVEESPDATVSSFAFRIMVYTSIRQNGDIYQNTLEKLGAAVEDLQNLSQSQKAEFDTKMAEYSSKMKEMETSYTNIVNQIETLDLTQLTSKVTALETSTGQLQEKATAAEDWKTAVLAGSEPVLIKTDEAPEPEPETPAQDEGGETNA